MSVQKTVAMTDHHPIAWFSGLQRREKNTFWACVGGWVLDAMDVQMFSFAIPAIIAVFAITNADAGLIGTATLLTSAFGGWFETGRRDGSRARNIARRHRKRRGSAGRCGQKRGQGMIDARTALELRWRLAVKIVWTEPNDAWIVGKCDCFGQRRFPRA